MRCYSPQNIRTSLPKLAIDVTLCVPRLHKTVAIRVHGHRVGISICSKSRDMMYAFPCVREQLNDEIASALTWFCSACCCRETSLVSESERPISSVGNVGNVHASAMYA